MGIFDSLVSLNEETKPAEIYVTGQTNVNTELIKAIAEESEKTDQDTTGLLAVWQKVETESEERLSADILAEISKRANFREVVDESSQPVYLNSPETFTAADDCLMGVLTVVPVSRFQSLFIRNLFVRFTDDTLPATVQVKVLDLDRGRVVQEKTVQTNLDAESLPVDITVDCSTFGRRAFFIGVFVPVGSVLTSFDWSNVCKYTTTELVTAPNQSELNVSDLDGIDECFVALEYELRLSPKKVLERYKHNLKRSFALNCAALIIDKGLKSKRASKWTLVNRDSEKENLGELQATYKKELAAACRLIYPFLEREELALVSRPDDQQSYFVGDYV